MTQLKKRYLTALLSEIVGRAIIHRLYLNEIAEFLGIIPGRLYSDRRSRNFRELPSITEVKDPRRDPRAVMRNHDESDAILFPRNR